MWPLANIHQLMGIKTHGFSSWGGPWRSRSSGMRIG
jgi:hypothetical protein